MGRWYQEPLYSCKNLAVLLEIRVIDAGRDLELVSGGRQPAAGLRQALAIGSEVRSARADMRSSCHQRAHCRADEHFYPSSGEPMNY